MADIKPLELDSLFLKKPQVAAMFQVSERTIESWVRDGILPAIRLGHSIRFDRENVIKQVRELQK